MQLKIDMLIKNGHVIDPARSIDGIADIAINGGHIIEVPYCRFDAGKTIDAEGCYVSPGFIDFHTHIFYEGTVPSCNPEYLPATGVTAAVDSGSAGSANYEIFHRDIVCRSSLKIKSYLNIFSSGQIDHYIP